MGDYISGLPDDVLCYILSFLTLRDAVRTRLLSPRCRYLPDCRPVLQFDALNVFGNESCNKVSYQSKFVRLVDQLLDTRIDQNLSVLKLRFGLGNDYNSQIDGWIVRVVTMGIKELDLDFSCILYPVKRYVVSCHQWFPSTVSSLTFLRLKYCELNLSSCCMSWISHLTTLHFSSICIKQKDMELILSCALNLTSLCLESCCYPTFKCLKIELLGLKKLVIEDCMLDIKLNCPNLEVFEYIGRLRNITFSHLPFLREVCLLLLNNRNGCSLIFAELIRYAPNLKAVSFAVRTEVQPLPFPAKITKSRIKQLDLLILVPFGFDLFTITYFLNASPALEILRLKVRPVYYTRKSPQKEYPDRPHFNLKEVEIDGLGEQWNSLELARYLLKNSVALQQMIVVCSDRRKEKVTTTLQQNVNASVKVVIRHH